jgi:serine/threonine-protein kinase HipA
MAFFMVYTEGSPIFKSPTFTKTITLGKWRLAPTYDLTFSYSGHGMHSTMVAGESANPTREHLMKLATYFKIKNAHQIIDEVQSVVNNWKKYAALCGVRNDSKNRIQKVIGR